MNIPLPPAGDPLPPPAAPLATCEACSRQLPVCWRFRADDLFCGLCRERVLELDIRQRDRDGLVWVYWRPDVLSGLTLTWRRKRTGRPLRQRIDFGRSYAHFGGPSHDGYLFDLRPLAQEGSDSESLVLSLVPRRQDLKSDALPETGAFGQVFLAGHAGDERFNALLLPWPTLNISCADPSNRSELESHVLLVYEVGKSVRLPMHLKTSVPIWLLPGGGTEAGADGLDILVRDLASPVRVDPGREFVFDMHVNTLDWAPGEPKKAKFSLSVLSVGRQHGSAEVKLIQGGKLKIGDPNVWELEMPLGRERTHSFTLTVQDAATPQEEIKVCEYRILPEVTGANWLHVESPPREALPFTVTPQKTVELQLRIDTSGLDRQRFSGQQLRGQVELRDAQKRPYYREVLVTLKRPDTHPAPLAIDWGTTNCCAAICQARGEDQFAQTIKFDKFQTSLELFPSDIYIKDVSDPNRPVILIGDAASARGQVHPECCLHSVKRKFRFLEKVFVTDEQGTQHPYELKRLVRFVLHRLLTMAENTLGREVVRLGLTFPTKWSAAARDRLREVTQELQAQLRKERNPDQIEIYPPEIDEANAVAINLLTSPHDLTLGQEFHLVAYDFGGGTVDTSVLKVTILEGRAEPCSEYIGIGGRGDFGGDDVTRAVMRQLQNRLTAALNGRELSLNGDGARKVKLAELPFVEDGEEYPRNDPQALEQYRLGRSNWDGLRKTAESIKIDLCNAAAPVPLVTELPAAGSAAANEDFGEGLGSSFSDASAMLEPDAGANPVKTHLRLAQLKGWFTEIGSMAARLALPLSQIEQGFSVEEIDRFYHDLRFTLREVYTQPLQDVYNTNGGVEYTVEERVEDTLRELESQCADRHVTPKVIVLAGGGCRLPLVKERMKHYFPHTHLHYDPACAKQRVAHGMASYLAWRARGNPLKRLARSVDVLHRHLGQEREVYDGRRCSFSFVPFVRIGTRLCDEATWHPMEFQTGEEVLRLRVFVKVWGQLPQLLGYFDLSQRGEVLPLDPPGEAGSPPLEVAELYSGELRLRGVRRMEVRVCCLGVWYGPYPLVLEPNCDPESLLQS